MTLWTQLPNTADPYSRLMAKAFDETDIIGVPTLWQSFFGRPETGGETLFSPDASVVDIDIQRGNTVIGALIPRGTINRPLGDTIRDTNLDRWTAMARRFPLAHSQGNITAAQLEFRRFGEDPHTPEARWARLRYHAHKHHREQVREQVRLFERLAGQSLITAVQDVILDTADADLQYNFLRLATHTFNAAAAWAGAGSNILGDITQGCRLIRQDAHVAPDVMFVGTTAFASMLGNTALLAWADSRRIMLFSVNHDPMPAKYQWIVDNGGIYRGIIETSDGDRLYIFTYLETFTDAAGAVQPYMPVNIAFIASTQARCDRYFGPGEQLPKTPSELEDIRFWLGVDQGGAMLPQRAKIGGSIPVSPEWFHFDVYKTGPKMLTVETQSAPIFAPTMTDAFATINAAGP